MGVPSGVTEVERRAVIEATMNAGAREAFLIDEPMAAAITRLPVIEASGNMVVDIGGGTNRDCGYFSGGVVSRSLRIAGDEMNEDIVRYARDAFNLLAWRKPPKK